jgi:hypothetical protein
MQAGQEQHQRLDRTFDRNVRYSGANGTRLSDRRASAIGTQPLPQCRVATLRA